jgi:hypothetical protein
LQSYLDATHIDHRGKRYVLGRTSDGYAIWDANLGGRPLRRFPLTSQGLAEAQFAFEQLEGGKPVFASPVGEWFAPRTAEWTEGRPMALGPMGTGQILDGAFKLYRMRFWTLLAVVAPILVPVQAIVLVITLATLEPVLLPTVPGGPTIIFQRPSANLTVGAALAQLLFVTPFLTAPVVKVAADTVLGQLATVGSTYRAALPRVHSILWVTLLTILSSLAFFVPAALVLFSQGSTGEGTAASLAPVLVLLGLAPSVYVLVRFLLASSTVMVEDARGIGAALRSWRLLRGITAKALGTYLLAILIVFVTSLVLTFVLGFILGIVVGIALGDELLTGGIWPALYAMQQAVNTLIGLLTTPFLTLVAGLLYFDARMRKEGFTLERIAQQIALGRSGTAG